MIIVNLNRYVDQGLSWNEEQLAELHFEVLAKINLNTEVPRTFRQLNINHIQRPKKSKNAIETIVDSVADVAMPQVLCIKF